MNILFVCTGNTCRSAMAQGIAQKFIEEYPEQLGHIHIASAGTFTNEGEKASANAIEVANQYGIDMESFGSQSVSPAMIKEADLVLAMTGNHKKLLNTLSPESQDKIFLLKEYQFGENVNQLNKEIKEYYDLYVQAKDQFVKGNQDRLQKLDELAKDNPQEAEIGRAHV